MIAEISEPNPRRMSGVTLLEITLALAITAVILVALVEAFTIASKSWSANRDELAGMHAARLAMFRICREIRQASDGDVGFPTPVAPGTSGSTLVIMTKGAQHAFSLKNGQLMYYKDVPAGTTSLASLTPLRLASNVSSLTFTAQSDGTQRLINVQIRMTVTVRSASFTLSDSAIVRKSRIIPDKFAPDVSSNPIPPL